MPLYNGLAALGLLNNVVGADGGLLTILLPFTTWLLKAGFDAVPREIEEAAHDRRRPARQISAPSDPAARHSRRWPPRRCFALLLAWDEFFYALLFTSDQRAKTLTVAIADLAGGRISDYGLIADRRRAGRAAAACRSALSCSGR